MTHHKHMLREVAKFATGMVAADFLIGVWLIGSDILPRDFLGVNLTPSFLAAWLVFDLVLIVILIHYAWHADIFSPTSTQKNIFVIVGIATGVIALLHLYRIVFGVSVVIGGWEAPLWLSGIGTVVAGYVSYASFKFVSKSR